MIKEAVFSFSGRLPEAWWDASGEERCLLPYYHMVSDAKVPHVSPLYRYRSVREFEADLDCLLKRRRPLSLGEFLEAVRMEGKPPARSFLLTFDDGFREMHDVAWPILQAKGVPALFFLTSATLDNAEMCHHQKIALLLTRRTEAPGRFPDAQVLRLLAGAGLAAGSDVEAALRSVPWLARGALEEIGVLCGLDFRDYASRKQPYLTSPQIDAMLAGGMDIGAHSIDHPRYVDIPFDEQIRQTRQSMEALTARFTLKRRAFAFPHTDQGVSRRFFDATLGGGMIDVSFGTSSPARDHVPLSFQRFTMEKTSLPARAIIARNRLRQYRLRALGRPLLDRS